MRVLRVLLVGAAVSIVGVVGACLLGSNAEEDTSQRPDRMATQPGWVQPFQNPVLKAGDLRRQALWNDPSPLKENGLYILYMTTSINEPFKPPIVPFRAVSADGVQWKLDPGTPVAMPTGTPFVNLETPSVVKFHGQYHMFFTAEYANPPAKPKDFAIGHAVSPDGLHFTVSPQPVLTATGQVEDWIGYIVGEPGAVIYNDQIYVYFCATGARPGRRPPQLQTIGLITTRDGEQFTAPIKVLGQSALYPPEKGFAGYSAPSAFVLNGKVHLLYDVALSRPNAHPEWQQVALHHAVSATDGRGDFVQDAKPMFTRNDFPWTMGEVIGPAAIVDGGKVKMWFGGHVPVSALGPLVRRDFSGPEFGINYAERSVADFQ